tara:strand:- start:994 stop:1317 length:324 start_codon:yes stop_codon:yes gene_type:complete
MTFYVKQNDTSPSILATLKDAAGAAVSLAGASVRLHMRKIGFAQVTVDQAATIVTAASGEVRYDWVAADTAAVGSYEAEIEVTYGDGSIETFPNDGFIRVEITDDIA